ncbi:MULTISPECIES: alpha/beta fold hydrolase [Nocardia]|uniref:alpha/beta fold hydrolase n=1 Tax=Nocardia TaxID=1817 RepID=UPI000D68B0C5|nr:MULTISPECIES: alpha/beta hydrolase [Nocardia]
MPEEIACGIGPSRIDIAYARFGDPHDPPVLLIMGGGAQMVNWPDGFLAELVAQELSLVIFDNRDVGRSSHLSDAAAVDIAAAMGGDHSLAVYDLSDMAADAVGLLTALGIDSAHLVGISMGAMIAQTMAIEYPTRVRSLTSISSTTGNPEVGKTDTGAFGAAGPQPRDRDGFIDWQIRAARALASPGFEFDAAAVAETAARAFDRGLDFEGMMRQMVAVIASGDRTDRLMTLRLPTLVIHGTADLAFDISGGLATAAAVPGAKLLTIDGMGHNLPRALWSRLADEIAELIDRAEARHPTHHGEPNRP